MSSGSLNEASSSEFPVDYLGVYRSEAGQRMQRPKGCNNSKDEDNTTNKNSVNNNFLSQRFIKNNMNLYIATETSSICSSFVTAPRTIYAPSAPTTTSTTVKNMMSFTFYMYLNCCLVFLATKRFRKEDRNNKREKLQRRRSIVLVSQSWTGFWVQFSYCREIIRYFFNGVCASILLLFAGCLGAIFFFFIWILAHIFPVFVAITYRSIYSLILFRWC